MKSLFQSMILAGAVFVTVGAAKAEGLNAKIPFAFSVNGKTMALGAYTLEAQPYPGAGTVFRVMNHTTRSSVMVYAPVRSQTPYAAKAKSEITFTCAGTFCELSQISSERGAQWKINPSKRLREAKRAGLEVRSITVHAD